MSDAATLAANRAIGRRVLLELWGEGKLEIADQLYAPGYIDHVARGPEPQRVSGPEGIKQAVTLFRTAFPDLTYSVEEEMAERDLVMTRFSARGTNLGPFLGHKPTGRVVTLPASTSTASSAAGSSSPGSTTARWPCSSRPRGAGQGTVRCDKPHQGIWRPRPESNRCARICSPLRNHSATWPCLGRLGEASLTK